MKNATKVLITEVLAQKDLSTDEFNGSNGRYGLLFAILLDGQMRTAFMDHCGSLVLTVSDLTDGRTKSERTSLMDAVNDGTLAGLQELSYGCHTDANLKDVSVLGELGERWAANYADLKTSERLSVHDGFTAFPPLNLHRRLNDLGEAAD